ncbi:MULTISPECIES: hypothetical protein [unclassified Thioclava]|uniref:hypothetical protein n=1 Tax=unclassified Thioclava TaxID=2621713 RepID=UPI0009960779|nr:MULTISPECIES: hypothetical protein [unclassified Thioclava]OOY06992.1 hypothetical protein BMI89_19975 [Thioclava sp. F36-7]OOY15006.1 hypothetical protein BMI85_15755 [Thioclava sp. DLFJ4-1]
MSNRVNFNFFKTVGQGAMLRLCSAVVLFIVSIVLTRTLGPEGYGIYAFADFHPGIVYKTHGLAEELPDHSGAKVVFLFGSATDAALSVLSCETRYGPDWIVEHFRHLRASGTIDELAQRDVLRFSDQLDGWIGKTSTPRIILRYGGLWDYQDALSDFTGVRVALPPKRARKGAGAADAETRGRFVQTYAALDARIAALPDCQVLA